MLHMCGTGEARLLVTDILHDSSSSLRHCCHLLCVGFLTLLLVY